MAPTLTIWNESSLKYWVRVLVLPYRTNINPFDDGSWGKLKGHQREDRTVRVTGEALKRFKTVSTIQWVKSISNFNNKNTGFLAIGWISSLWGGVSYHKSKSIPEANSLGFIENVWRVARIYQGIEYAYESFIAMSSEIFIVKLKVFFSLRQTQK